MKIAIGADHAGFILKERLRETLAQDGHEVCDSGTGSEVSCDYPDYAAAVAREVASGRADRGILVCCTGVGMSIAANKFAGIRAALGTTLDEVRLVRDHNDANVLTLGAAFATAEEAEVLVDVFLTTAFSCNGRHIRRIAKIAALERGATGHRKHDTSRENGQAAGRGRSRGLRGHPAANSDRQNSRLELIASENFTSEAVLEAAGSVFTNKYAEGYPGKRYYGGCEFIDVVENLARDRAKKLFRAEYANVQPHAGSQANLAAYAAVLQPGDTILGMNLSHGGHLTHGHPLNFSGKTYKVIPYGVRREDEIIDYDELARLAVEHRPKLIIAGGSAYPRIIDFQRFRQIADSVGAILLVDMAHFSGLVAAGLHPNPCDSADIVTSTTHKTLRGPRSGIILAKAKYGAGHRQERLPRHARRPPGAHHRGQGGLLPGGHDCPSSSTIRNRCWPTPGRWPTGWWRRAGAWCPAARTRTCCWWTSSPRESAAGRPRPRSTRRTSPPTRTRSPSTSTRR